MRRVVYLALFIAGLCLLAVDGQLALNRFGASGVNPLNPWKIAAAIVIQVFALAFTAWYAMFLVRPERSSKQPFGVVSLRIRLLPFVVPVVLFLASVALLENGLLCGDLTFLSARGRSFC